MGGADGIMCVKMLLPEMVSYAASCMTIFREFGIRQTKPFAAVCTNVLQEDELVERCKIFSDNRKYSVQTFMTCRADIMSKCKDDTVFLQYTQGVDENFLPRLCDIMGEGYFENEAINCVICLLFNGFIPDEVTEFFSVIIPNQEITEFLRVQYQSLNVQQMLVNQRDSSEKGWFWLVDVLNQKNYKNYIAESLKEAELLYAAASVKALLQNTPEQSESLYDIVKSKIMWSEDLRDKSDIPGLFVEKLYEYAKILYPIISSREVSCRYLDKQYAMFSDDYYYLPEILMAEIIRKMAQYAGATEIKRVLMTAGYLEVQGQNRNYYTQKVKVADKRYHFYLLRRDRIDRIGEVTLLQLCNLKGEG